MIHDLPARIRSRIETLAPLGVLLVASLVASAGCSPDTATPGQGQAGPLQRPGAPIEQPARPAATDFSLRATGADPVLVEGAEPIVLPFALERLGGNDAPITLSLEGANLADVAFVRHAFEPRTLEPGVVDTRLTLRLDIADRSIRPGERRFVVVASDGTRTARVPLDVTVEPVDAPDVYLLVGQSNMVGSSGGGTRRAGPGEPDEPTSRVRQLNVTANDPRGVFTDAAAFRSPESNVAGEPLIVAEDPLHVPRDTSLESGKSGDYIGLGLTFGKAALADTTRDVVLVPAAWGGSSFCASDNGPSGHWNPDPTDEPVLGNTLLFDRAVVRANAALAESGGILRGILWHQGESDANTPCATLYGENLAKLAAAFRTRIVADARGPALRAADAPIPFVAGTMSQGVIDADNDYSYESYNSAKRTIDAVHRDVASLVPYAAASIHDDVVPANGFECGQGDCIHFGAAALREMGVRYHEALGRALANAPAAAGPPASSAAADVPAAP